MFTPEVVNACGDKTLQDACEQFNELHDASVDALSTNAAVSYLEDVLRGKTSTISAATTRVENALTPYKRTIEKME